jgi:hypothetical protein
MKPSDAVVFEARFHPQPPRVGALEVRLTLRDSSGNALDGASLSLEGNMSHPGMVPVLGQAVGLGSGAYADTLELTMAGDWHVRVWGTLADGRAFERVVPLPGVRPREE